MITKNRFLAIAITVGLCIASCSKKDSNTPSSNSTSSGNSSSTKKAVDVVVAGIYLQYGYSGDNGPATAAKFQNPTDVAMDSKGNLYIVDSNNDCIRKIDNAGTITTYTGKGVQGYPGSKPVYIAIDAQDNLYISDFAWIFKMNTNTGVITPVINIAFSSYGTITPTSLAADSQGNVYFADKPNNRIFKATASGTITMVIGDGKQGYSGDGGAATAAEFYSIESIVIDKQNNLYIADAGNSCVRKVSAGTGIITTFAGNGTQGDSGDGGVATAAKLDYPIDLALDTQGNVYISDENSSRIRMVTATTGVISNVYAELAKDFVVDAKSNIYYSVKDYNVIRKISFQ